MRCSNRDWCELMISMARGVERGKLSPSDRDVARAQGFAGRRISRIWRNQTLFSRRSPRTWRTRRLSTELDRLCPADRILASNTSSLSITEMASVTGRPDRVLGLHFFNPVPVMKPVELIRGLQTSEETVAAGRAFCEQLGKTVVTCKDYPGFIVNLLLCHSC